MKYLTVIILAFSLNACTQNKITPKGSETEKKQDIPFDEFDISDISLIRLIATPEKYDGKQVRVIGYLNLEFEGNAIYLHKEDYSKALSTNGFSVDFTKKIVDKKNLYNYNKSYVLIIGTFDMNDKGHMGLFGGKIKNITRLDSWDFSY